MRKGSYLINASRGTVVDIDALTEALKSGHIAGAAIDVFPLEPKSNNESGVLQSINQVFFDKEINIAAQYLQTDGDIGYVVMDVESEHLSDLIEELAKIPATIRTRVLH